MWQKYIVHIVDVLLMLYIVYRFVIYLRGTRAIRIFGGVVLFLVFTIIVVMVLKLPITSWILQKFWIAGVVLFAIVFQPEIRAALAELYLPGKITNAQKILFVEEIISAVKELSETRTGALIVIEGRVGLKEFVRTGVVLNADVSKELLESIFYKGNVLHDGAVIISRNKIIAARCILPLCDEIYVKHFGTRHRAAAGVAQVSDASVIVCSEETGRISFFKNKSFDTKISIEQLREKLTESLSNNVVSNI